MERTQLKQKFNSDGWLEKNGKRNNKKRKENYNIKVDNKYEESERITEDRVNWNNDY